MVLRCYTDGGARGNPGPAGIGVYVCLPDTTPIASYCEYIQENTNNFAECFAVYRLAQLLVKRCSFATKIEIYLDSELVTKQLKGEYKIKNEKLIEIHSKIRQLFSQVNAPISFTHILRKFNSIADSLVNKAIDSKTKDFQWFLEESGESGQSR
jgi:ribonuclease HI